MSRWSDLAAAQAQACRVKGHAMLCDYAAKLLPRLDEEDAARLRLAMAAGPDGGLRPLITELNLRVAA